MEQLITQTFTLYEAITASDPTDPEAALHSICDAAFQKFGRIPAGIETLAVSVFATLSLLRQEDDGGGATD